MDAADSCRSEACYLSGRKHGRSWAVKRREFICLLGGAAARRRGRSPRAGSLSFLLKPSAPCMASSTTPENFRDFAAKPHHANRKAEYQGQHDDPRARLPITKQSEQKCQRRDYG